jgi:hypothetical protein
VVKKLKFQKASRIGGRPSFYVYDLETQNFLFLHWNGLFKSWAITNKLENIWSEENLKEIQNFVLNLNKPEEEEKIGNMV